MSTGNGTHQVQISPGAKYFVHTYSTIKSLPTYRIVDQNWKEVRVLEDNSNLKEKLKEYTFSDVEITKIPNKQGVQLNSILIKPTNFDPTKKYPVFMFLYGGPGSQQVANKWNSFGNYWWFQLLADKGYLIAIVDNRGTGGRGEEFKNDLFAIRQI